MIQQRGLDLSVPGMITLTTIIVTKYPNGAESKLPAAIGLVVLACVASGTISGLAVTQLGITPLVATLGTGALLTGAVLQITSGTAQRLDARGAGQLRAGEDGRHPEHGADRRRRPAPRHVRDQEDRARPAVRRRGRKPAAARAAGIPVRAYELGTYIVAGLAYGGAGILIAGFLGRRASRPGTTTCCRRSRPSSWAARRSRAAEAA